ncbi:MAG: OmpA family protein [Bacteroidota bacterium]
MKKDYGRLYWVSYADLMTALFIVALALFVLSYKMFKMREAEIINMEDELRVRSLELDKSTMAIDDLKRTLTDREFLANSLVEQLNNERARLLVMEEEYKKLREIQKAIENLDSRYFMYQPEYKRHVLRTQVTFPKGQSVINQQYQPMLMNAGRALKRLIDQLEPDDNIKYLLVIEGMASKDAYTRNYELSYERALSLVRLWETQGIQFDPNRFEVMISGSGESGVGRDIQNEANNQRFLIQIIPKIGELRGVNYDAVNQGDSTVTEPLNP